MNQVLVIIAVAENFKIYGLKITEWLKMAIKHYVFYV